MYNTTIRLYTLSYPYMLQISKEDIKCAMRCTWELITNTTGRRQCCSSVLIVSVELIPHFFRCYQTYFGYVLLICLVKLFPLLFQNITHNNGFTFSSSFELFSISWYISGSTINFKGALKGLRQFLASQSPLKKMKNAFYFTLKAIFILKIFNFLFWHFGHVGKRLD